MRVHIKLRIRRLQVRVLPGAFKNAALNPFYLEAVALHLRINENDSSEP